MMMRTILMCFCLLILGGSSSLRAHQFIQISDSPGESHFCRVASDDWANSVVAWVEEDSGVWTRCWREGELHDPVFQGPGELPDVAVTGEWGFVLAWVQDGAIIVREGNGVDWTDVRVYAQDAAQLTLPRLTGFDTNMWVHGAYLCWQNDLGEIYFAGRPTGEWLDPEYVMPLAGWAGFAQAVPGPTDDPWQPRVFVMQDGGLEFSQRSAEGWGPPEAVLPGTAPFGGEFAAGGGGNHPAQILGNGPQPTCPCNIMLYSRDLPDTGWTPPEDLTHYFDEYSWPMDPAITVDQVGDVHAFWYQQHYDVMMQPSFEGVHYRVLHDGVWSDETAVLAGHFGKDTDLDLSGYDPAFTWAEGLDGEREVWLAIHPHVMDSPPAPAQEPVLSASPNPFNPRTDLRFHLPHAARLSLDIVAPSGRRVLRLAAGRYPAGEHRFVWDGRDESGRALPSGVYLAKLTTEQGDAALKLAMLR